VEEVLANQRGKKKKNPKRKSTVKDKDDHKDLGKVAVRKGEEKGFSKKWRISRGSIDTAQDII
jgi:hypothetical protein